MNLRGLVALLRVELFGECLEITGVDGNVIIEHWRGFETTSPA